jgi:hypothetical protein
VGVQPLGIDHHGGDPVPAVSPRNVLDRRGRLLRAAEIEPVDTIGWLLRIRCRKWHQASQGLLDSLRERALGEPLDSGEIQGAGAVEELTARALQQDLEGDCARLGLVAGQPQQLPHAGQNRRG